MKLFKDYIYLFFILVALISYLFIDFIDGSNFFTSGDTLSPIAVKNAIKFYLETFNEFPFWFPSILGGIPTIHSFLYISNYYYPHQSMVLLNQIGVPWIWYFIFHLIFGSMGMYSLLTFLKNDKLSSVFGSVLFLFMPYMITMTAYGHGSQMMSASYIPWIILFLFKINQKINLFNLCIFSLLIGLQLLRGHIQIAYYTWMMIGLFILTSFCHRCFNKENNIIALLKNKFTIIFFILIGLLISLSIYLPILSYSEYSIRGAVNGGAGLDYATQWSMSIKEFLTIIFPYSLGFGGPLYFGDLPFTDYPNYIGILIIGLAIIGIKKSNILNLYKIFFIMVIIFSFFISLGNNFIEFYKVFYNYFPYFNKFRVPSYILILFNFSIIIFASGGLSKLVNSTQYDLAKNKIYYIVCCFIFVLSFFYMLFGTSVISDNSGYKAILSDMIFNDGLYLFSSILLVVLLYIYFNYKNYNKYVFKLLIIFICTYDYIRIDQEIINPKSHIPHKKISKSNTYINKFLAEDELTSYLKNDLSKYRIYDFVGNPNRWSINGIENFGGYHPAKLSNYNRFINFLYNKGYQLYPPGILQLLNIKYIILPNTKFQHKDFSYIGQKEMSYFGNNSNYDGKDINVDLFLFNRHYPRLFYSNKVEYSNSDYIFDKIIKENYSPGNVVYVSDEINSFEVDDFNRNVDMINWSPNRIEFKTSCLSDQFLVISEIFYPHDWKLIMGGDDSPDSDTPIKYIHEFFRNFKV